MNHQIPYGKQHITDDDIKAVSNALEGANWAFVMCFDAGLYKGWEQILKAARQKAKHCVIIPTRDPYDVRFVDKNAAIVTGYGFRKCQMDAVMKLIIG